MIHRIRISSAIGLCLAVLPMLASAGEDPAAAIADTLTRVKPGLTIASVAPSRIDDLFEVMLEDGSTLYATADGTRLIAGDLFEVDETGLVNLAEQSRRGWRRNLLAGVSEDDMLIFTPAGATLTTIDVFTDTDCGFCRALHRDMTALNALGIEVRYLAYPRAGVGSPTYQRMVSAWCSDDPNTALTALKSGEEIPPLECANPVADELEVGRRVGVQGTPTIVTDQGELILGYASALELAQRLGVGG